MLLAPDIMMLALSRIGAVMVIASITLEGAVMNDPWWVYLLGSGGGLAILTLIIKEIMSYVRGRSDDRVTRNASLELQRDTAWKERDEEQKRANCEARNARMALNYAAVLRRQLIRAGVEEKDIIPEPLLENCDLN